MYNVHDFGFATLIMIMELAVRILAFELLILNEGLWLVESM